MLTIVFTIVDNQTESNQDYAHTDTNELFNICLDDVCSEVGDNIIVSKQEF